jgi:hypothetical protein
MDNSTQNSKNEHLNNLSEIRSLMERSSSFISLSGLSGVSAGIIGLIAAVILHQKIKPIMDYEQGNVITAAQRTDIIYFGIMLSAVVLIVTFALAIFFTARKAKKSGLPVWDGSAKRLVQSLFVPLVAGGVFCLILLYHRYDWLVMPSMLIFYGLALLNASKYTLHEIRWLGLSQIALGLLATFFLTEAVYFWGMGFGVMNIIYGLVMYIKHERT